MSLQIEADTCTVADNAEPAIHVEPMIEAKPSRTSLGRAPKQDLVLINVRFSPDGTVNTIDRRPAHISPQEWFHSLWRSEGADYQVFAGGRGHFRFPRSAFEAILSQNAI